MDSVEQRVAKCVAQVLALDLIDIKPGSRLMEDLGAESLDLVELMYVIEAEFGVRMEQKDMSLTAQLGIPEQEIHQAEVLTPRALALLRERFPGHEALLVEGTTRKQLAELLTVAQVARSVERKIAG
jgi:acyl carrier protein